MTQCPKCGVRNSNPSGFCDLEPEGWEDSSLIIADRERQGPSRVALLEARFKAEAAITPTITRVVELPESGKRTRRAAVEVPSFRWVHDGKGNWSKVQN